MRFLLKEKTTLTSTFQGIVLGMTGPTLTEMALKLQVTYEEISPAYSVKGLGMLVGAPLGGHLTDKCRFKPLFLYLTCFLSTCLLFQLAYFLL